MTPLTYLRERRRALTEGPPEGEVHPKAVQDTAAIEVETIAIAFRRGESYVLYLVYLTACILRRLVDAPDATPEARARWTREFDLARSLLPIEEKPFLEPVPVVGPPGWSFVPVHERLWS